MFGLYFTILGVFHQPNHYNQRVNMLISLRFIFLFVCILLTLSFLTCVLFLAFPLFHLYLSFICKTLCSRLVSLAYSTLFEMFCVNYISFKVREKTNDIIQYDFFWGVGGEREV